MKKVSIIEEKKIDCKGYTLIEGFPGMGLVGTIVARYLTENLEFEKIGYIDSDYFLPIIRIEKGLPINPARIYCSKKHKIILMLTEQIIDEKSITELVNEIVSWIEKKGIKEVISLAGIRTKEKEEKVYGIASNENEIKILKKYGIELIQEGITTGVTAKILLKLKNKKINTISILGDVKLQADYKAASEVIKKLNELFKMNINVKPLLNEAKKTEKELITQLKKLKELKEKIELTKKPEAPSYYA